MLDDERSNGGNGTAVAVDAAAVRRPTGALQVDAAREVMGAAVIAPYGEARRHVVRRGPDGAGREPYDVDAAEAHGIGSAVAGPDEAAARGAMDERDGRAASPPGAGSVRDAGTAWRRGCGAAGGPVGGPVGGPGGPVGGPGGPLPGDGRAPGSEPGRGRAGEAGRGAGVRHRARRYAARIRGALAAAMGRGRARRHRTDLPPWTLSAAGPAAVRDQATRGVVLMGARPEPVLVVSAYRWPPPRAGLPATGQPCGRPSAQASSRS